MATQRPNNSQTTPRYRYYKGINQVKHAKQIEKGTIKNIELNEMQGTPLPDISLH